MKLSKKLLIILTVAGAVILGSDVIAQEKKDAPPPPAAAPPAPGAPGAPDKPAVAPRDPTAGLIRFLNLSEEQKGKIKPILDQEIADMKAIREDKAINRTEQMAKIRASRDATTAKVKPLLNEEQAQKWERMRGARPPGAQPPRPGQPGQPGVPPPAPKAAPEK
jgi:periplasmic protein CpxP/Spy